MTNAEAIALFHPQEAVPTAAPAAAAMTPIEALAGGFDLCAANDGDRPVENGQPASGSQLQGQQLRQGFRIGALRLMVRYEDGSELTEMPAVYQLPNVPDWFCGVANLHGLLTPVFELSRYIGIEPEAGAKRMLLVLSRGADAAGVVIDGLPERLRWTDKERTDTSAAPANLAAHLRGACLLGEHLWFDLDCKALLDALEQAMGAPK